MTDQKTIKARISRAKKDESVEMEVDLDLIKEKVKLWCSDKIIGWREIGYDWEDRGYCCPYEDEDYFIWAIFQSIDGTIFVICYLTPGIVLFEDDFDGDLDGFLATNPKPDIPCEINEEYLFDFFIWPSGEIETDCEENSRVDVPDDWKMIWENLERPSWFVIPKHNKHRFSNCSD